MVAKKSAQGGAAAGAGGGAVPVTKAVAKKAVARKSAAGKTSPRKAADGRAVARAPEEAAAEAVAGEAPGDRTAAGKTAVKKAAVKKAAAGKTAGRTPAGAPGTASAGKAAGAVTAGGGSRAAAGEPAAGVSTAKDVGAAHAAEQTGATTVVAKKTPGTATAAKTPLPTARGTAAEPGDLAVRPGEDPWTPEEAAQAHAELRSEQERLETEIGESERSLAGLMRDSGDGAGDDQADTGTKNITREHELALTANAREMLTQTEHALERLEAGTYGLCENCGRPIGKARMQAFPRATLCVECKQKQERRY
ncbi:MAG TPA: TraR/DksA C4-type zinc finger protein [Streptomyces sp.]|nr:TraR/DksA C4-type zinc finger protein [Streptomyces sp.]